MGYMMYVHVLHTDKYYSLGHCYTYKKSICQSAPHTGMSMKRSKFLLSKARAYL